MKEYQEYHPKLAESYNENYDSTVYHAQYDAVVSWLEKLNFGRFLDIGCGNGSGVEIFQDKIKKENYVGFDKSEAMIKEAQITLPGRNLLVGALEDIKLPDESRKSFD